MLNTTRNKTTDAAPAVASTLLIVGDSIGADFRFGAGAGAVLEQVDTLTALGGETVLINAAWGGYKLLGESGTDRFLNFIDLAEAQALTDAKAIMGAHAAVDAVAISLGTNDLEYVEGGFSEISGYNEAKIEAALAALISAIRTENGANGGASTTLPVIIIIPGRDESVSRKEGTSKIWRKACIDAASADANVHLLDFYHVPIEDSVHPSPSGYHILGFGLGRLFAKHAHSAAGVGGPPTIQSITKSSSTKMRIVFDVPSGESLTQPTMPSAWRVEDAISGTELPILRLDWVNATTADLTVGTGTSNQMKLFAPYDLGITNFDPAGIIRTDESGDNSEPGFVLQSYEGTTT